MNLDKVMVPVATSAFDGLERADEALAVAKRCLAAGGKLVLVAVVPPEHPQGGPKARDEEAKDREQSLAKAGRLLTELAQKMKADGLSIEERIVADAKPAARLAQEAADSGVVIISSHSHRGLAKVVLGSMAEELVRLSPVPVLVLHGALEPTV